MLPTGLRRLLANRAALVTYAIGLPTIAIAFIAAWRDASQNELPGLLRWACAGTAVTFFLLLASESYAVLLERTVRAKARSGFLTSQLVKYNPLGGPAQLVSQVAMAPDEALVSAQTVMRSKITAVAGGLAWAPVCAVSAPDLPILLRIGLAITGFGLLVGHPAVSRMVFGLLARRSERLKMGPTDKKMLVAHVWSTLLAAAAAGSLGVAFVFMVAADGSAGTILAAISAYAVAWTVGYLAVPFPGGIGVREGVLLFLAPFELSDIVVAAILLRLTQVGIEILLATAGSALLRRTSNTST